MFTFRDKIRANIGDVSLEGTLDLLDFCRRYQRLDPIYRPPYHRFLIGFYQIHQARNGRDSAWAAGPMNLLMAAEGAGAPSHLYLPADLNGYVRHRFNFVTDAPAVLDACTHLAQQYHYLSLGAHMVRNSRVSLDTIALCTALVVSACFGQLEVGERKQYVEEEATRLEALEYRAPQEKA